MEKLGRADGPLNLARVYFKEGRLDDAVAALQRAAKFDPPAPRWTVAWFNGLVNKQNGFLDKAITEFRSILEDRYPELDKRGFDFSKDYEVINELGPDAVRTRQAGTRRSAASRSSRKLPIASRRRLAIDSENLTAHYNLALIYAQLGDARKPRNIASCTNDIGPTTTRAIAPLRFIGAIIRPPITPPKRR